MTASFAKLLRQPVLRPLALVAVLSAALAIAQTTPPATTPGTTPGTTLGTTSGQGEAPLPGTEAQRAELVKSSMTLDKFTRIDILGKLLPLNLTKEQIRALLPAIEKARKQEFDTRLLDAKLIGEMDAEVTKAIEAGIAKGDVPSVELQNKIRKVTGAIVVRRNVATNEMMDLIYAAAQKSLDAGQMKVMANTLKPELIAPGMKVDTEEAKIRFYIRYIFLDAQTYDILLKMSRAA